MVTGRCFAWAPHDGAGPRREFRSADDEGLELFDQVVAMIGINFQGDRLGEIQAEDAQDGLTVYDMAADAQVDIVGIFVSDVYKELHVFSKAELDINCFHAYNPL